MSDTSNSYTEFGQHLADQLALVTRLFERQLESHWEAGTLVSAAQRARRTALESLLRPGLPTKEFGANTAVLDKAISKAEQDIFERLTHCDERVVPFERIRRNFGLTSTELRVLWVTIAVDSHAPTRLLMRYLVNEGNRRVADVSLMQMLVYGHPSVRHLAAKELSSGGRLFQTGLLRFAGSDTQIHSTPFLLRPITVVRRVVELAHGVCRLARSASQYAELVQFPQPGDHLQMSPGFLQQARSLMARSQSDALLGRAHPAVLFAGPVGSGRTSLAMAGAAHLGVPALRIQCANLPREIGTLTRALESLMREALVFQAIPVFCGIDALAGDQQLARPATTPILNRVFRDYIGPMAGTCASGDVRPVDLSRSAVVVHIPIPSEAQRSALWQTALADRGGSLNASDIAARYPITGGVLSRSASSAKSLANARGHVNVTADDIHAGLRATLDSKLSNLGTRIRWSQRWSDLILPVDSIEEIHEFIGRVRHKRRVYDEWGFARKMAKGLGLSALFAGPPGTGKTMVAGLIAAELGLDLYQVDLSKIVSKYIGETEKKLSELFDAAEAGHAVLLFDEADSLFAKRTEVKSSVDRYANLEVNYLLQRMEVFTGVTILTTNLDSSIDDAFARRIAFRVNFPFPEPEDRARLWQAMLPDEAAVDGDIEWNRLADRYEMSGGYIRNAVVRAAFLAASDAGPIAMRHLAQAATLEYQAMGKVIAHT